MNAHALPSYAEAFLQYFDVSLADTASSRDRCFHIRYRVYCQEFEYEEVAAGQPPRESDEFDEQSLHCLVTHRSSGAPAGCVRIVRSSPQVAGGMLPFEKYCSASLNDDYRTQVAQTGRGEVCEVSRLAVDGMFRRRSGEKATRFGGLNIANLSKEEQRTFPLVAVSCFLAATAVTDLADCTNTFAMMEPFLPRILARSGIHFQRVGDDVDYHGLRAAYSLRTAKAVAEMAPDLGELYGEIYRIISGQFQANS